jgi:hypothetical protein
VGRGAGSIIFFLEASVVQWKDIRPWRPEYGPEGKHFVSGLFFYLRGWGRGAQRPVSGGNELKKTGARSARVAMSSKRRARAAHGRARAAKTH